MGGMVRRGGWPGRYPQQMHPDGEKILEQIYDRIQEELRNQYSLGYTPDPADAGPGYHKIRLTATQKDLTVQARDRYYAER